MVLLDPFAFFMLSELETANWPRYRPLQSFASGLEKLLEAHQDLSACCKLALILFVKTSS